MPTVLIVDDDEIDREAASRHLRKVEGLDLLHAADGNEAIAAVSKERLDVVLTDLRMPGMDGLELVEKMHQEFPLVPVILMTGEGSERIAVRALKAGAASYVPKRDLKRTLAETVQQVLEVSEARRSEREVLRYVRESVTRLELPNDPALIPPLVGFLSGSLDRLGFGTETVRTQVGMALAEAVSNAMIHGNLEVGSELRWDDREEYHRLIRERREQEPYAGRRVRCTATETPERIEYVVLDEGPGFDPGALPEATAPEDLLRVSGRGLFLIRTFMDEVEFNEKGNEIRMGKGGG